MTVTNQNFKVFRGNTHSLDIALTQADGTPYDPTLNAVLRWRLTTSAHAKEEDAIIRKSTGNGITVAGNVATIVLATEDTDIDPGLYYHELRVWEGADIMTTMIGNAVVRRAVQMGDNVAPAAKQAIIERKVPTRTP
jgi:hypothetical protein